ncbi:hypothetical protein AAE478_009725 [Parahypoxylon ruwenzoriense]
MLRTKPPVKPCRESFKRAMRRQFLALPPSVREITFRTIIDLAGRPRSESTPLTSAVAHAYYPRPVRSVQQTRPQSVSARQKSYAAGPLVHVPPMSWPTPRSRGPFPMTVKELLRMQDAQRKSEDARMRWGRADGRRCMRNLRLFRPRKVMNLGLKVEAL